MKTLRGYVAGLALMGAAVVGTSAPAAAQYNWGGLYGGVNAGWAGVDYSQQWVFLLGPPGPEGTSVSPSKDEGILGGHIGLQHQFGTFVVGVEAAASSTAPFGNNLTSGPANGTTFTSQLRLGTLYTVGGRLGWTPSSQWLLFVGGGFASASINQKILSPTGVEDSTLATAERHNGWYLGGGFEYALTSNWIVGLEYQHIALDGEQHCRGPRISAGTCLGAGDNSTSRIDADVDIVRARISYKLGRPEPVAEPMK